MKLQQSAKAAAARRGSQTKLSIQPVHQGLFDLCRRSVELKPQLAQDMAGHTHHGLCHQPQGDRDGEGKGGGT